MSAASLTFSWRRVVSVIFVVGGTFSYGKADAVTEEDKENENPEDADDEAMFRL